MRRKDFLACLTGNLNHLLLSDIRMGRGGGSKQRQRGERGRESGDEGSGGQFAYGETPLSNESSQAVSMRKGNGAPDPHTSVPEYKEGRGRGPAATHWHTHSSDPRRGTRQVLTWHSGTVQRMIRMLQHLSSQCDPLSSLLSSSSNPPVSTAAR